MALALLGQSSGLTEECFQPGLLPYAVTAVARCQGRHGLKWALAADLDPAAVAELAAALKAPDVTTVEQLRAWCARR